MTTTQLFPSLILFMVPSGCSIHVASAVWPSQLIHQCEKNQRFEVSRGANVKKGNYFETIIIEFLGGWFQIIFFGNVPPLTLRKNDSQFDLRVVFLTGVGSSTNHQPVEFCATLPETNS